MIEVRIDVPTISAAYKGNSVGLGNEIMTKLRAAGIPIIGVLWPQATENGFLVVTIDEVFGEYIYRWFPKGEPVIV